MTERWTPAYARLFDPDHQLREREPVCRAFAWLDLCHMAQWRDGARIVGGSVIPLERGTLLASIRFLAERWSWSRGRVERFLAVLQHDSVAKIETVGETPGGTIYRIVTYDDYDPTRDRHGDSDGAANGTATGPPTGPATGTNNNLTSRTSRTSVGRAERKRATPLPDSWEPNEGHQDAARSEGLNLQHEVENFRDHARATGRTLKDWDAGFRMWLRKAKKFASSRAPSPTAQFGDETERDRKRAEEARRRQAVSEAEERRRMAEEADRDREEVLAWYRSQDADTQREMQAEAARRAGPVGGKSEAALNAFLIAVIAERRGGSSGAMKRASA